MVPPHVLQSTSDTATAVATSDWHLEQARIDASQEMVVTTTTLTLHVPDHGASFLKLPQRLLSKLSIPIQRVFPQSEHSANTRDSTTKGTQECQVTAQTRRRTHLTAAASQA
jgi:hypothetical protein